MRKVDRERPKVLGGHALIARPLAVNDYLCGAFWVIVEDDHYPPVRGVGDIGSNYRDHRSEVTWIDELDVGSAQGKLNQVCEEARARVDAHPHAVFHASTLAPTRYGRVTEKDE
jgi:hypothetical protein